MSAQAFCFGSLIPDMMARLRSAMSRTRYRSRTNSLESQVAFMKFPRPVLKYSTMTVIYISSRVSVSRMPRRSFPGLKVFALAIRGR